MTRLHLALSALVLALTVGCAPARQDVWLKPGTTSLRAEQDFLSCAARARRDFPERPRIATAPRVTIGTGLCRSGVCVGVNNSPEIFETDRNEPLRVRAVAACMQARGYAPASLPRCPAGAARPLAEQPSDTAGLCLINGQTLTR